ncbi:hypothetical protein GCM10011498_37900 [Amylibacter cionae]|uniref:Uncharacterized protein n=1 Tax=Neptunicoccus cionae TaxID=2035344 RepID=A0A916R4F3_9RHOB|nr:hypothetical protein GCM10011498_37900 [Amylibacter cionae]
MSRKAPIDLPDGKSASWVITNRFETRHEEGGRTNLVTFHLIEDPQDAVHRDFLALGLSPERTVSGKENPIPSSRQAKCKDIWRR